MDNGARVALKAYRLSWLVVGSQLLWDISRFQGLINDSSRAVSAKWMCDRWDDSQKIVAAAGMRHQDHFWKGISSQSFFWKGLRLEETFARPLLDYPWSAASPSSPKCFWRA